MAKRNPAVPLFSSILSLKIRKKMTIVKSVKANGLMNQMMMTKRVRVEVKIKNPYSEREKEKTSKTQMELKNSLKTKVSRKCPWNNQKRWMMTWFP